MTNLIVLFAVFVAMLVVAYVVVAPPLPQPVRTLLLVVGWLGAIIVGVLLLLTILGVAL